MKLHFPQECSEMMNTDVPSTPNCLHTPDDAFRAQEEMSINDVDNRSGKKLLIITVGIKKRTSKDSKVISWNFFVTNCLI
jgi:hypothetical protein